MKFDLRKWSQTHVQPWAAGETRVEQNVPYQGVVRWTEQEQTIYGRQRTRLNAKKEQ